MIDVNIITFEKNELTAQNQYPLYTYT